MGTAPVKAAHEVMLQTPYCRCLASYTLSFGDDDDEDEDEAKGMAKVRDRERKGNEG